MNKAIQTAAQSAQQQPGAEPFFQLSDACGSFSLRSEGGITAALALSMFFDIIARRLDDRPVETAEVSQIMDYLSELLNFLSEKGIEDTDPFANKLEKLLKKARAAIH